MTIAKKGSSNSGSLLLHTSCVWNICLKDDYVFHNAHKDEDRSIDLPRGQLNDNVGILESALELVQVNMNLLVAIQHSGTGLVWYHLEYER
jgi:hypothetical protein